MKFIDRLFDEKEPTRRVIILDENPIENEDLRIARLEESLEQLMENRC
jgi:hypothetical protein